MKKRVLVLFIILVLVLVNNFASAYVCSDGSEISKESREIEKNERKLVNGLGIALISSREHAVLGRVEAELILEAEKISLTNESNSKQITFSSGTYTITLVNTTETTARVRIGSSEGEVSEHEYKTIGNLELILSKVDSSSGGSADIIIGNKKISLSNDEKPFELAVNSRNYLIEIFSASSSSAIISVWKCNSGNIVEIKEDKKNETAENATTQTPVINETVENGEENITGNESLETVQEGEESIFSRAWVFVIAFFLIIIAYIIYRKFA